MSAYDQEQIICQHCDEPCGETITVSIVADRKMYDVLVCPRCHEVIGKATPAKPTHRGWEGIMRTASVDEDS